MYRSRACTLLWVRLASVNSQAGVWKIGSGVAFAEELGRVSMMLCTSASLRPGSAARTASDAVLMLTRPGESEVVMVVNLSYTFGNSWRMELVSLIGLG